MDYAGANANSLYKYQWDYIHNPQKMIGLLQDDEEGAYEYFISDEQLFENMHAELAYWKWRKDGFPELTQRELSDRYDLKTDYAHKLFRGICLDYDKIETKLPDVFALYEQYYKEYLMDKTSFSNEEYILITTLIKEHYALGNKIVFESLMNAGQAINLYFNVLTMVAMPAKLPVGLNIGKSIAKIGNVGKAIATLSKTRAAVLMGRFSVCFAKAKPELWLKNFLIGAGMEAASSFTSGLVINKGEIKTSIENIDWIDVVSEGAINVVYGKAATIKELFRGGTYQVIKGTSIVTLKIIKASIDIDIEDGFKTSFANQDGEFYKALNESFMSFVIDMGKEVTTQDFLEKQKIWAASDINPTHFAPLTQSQKVLASRINTLVNNEMYGNMIDFSFDVVKTVFEDQLQKNMVLEVEVISNEPLIDDGIQPADKTKYVGPR
jgi:hypothetical protein